VSVIPDPEEIGEDTDEMCPQCPILEPGGGSEESESESEEEEIWRCPACCKDFKSEGQMANHEKSRKHKEQWKKYEKRQAQIRKELQS